MNRLLATALLLIAAEPAFALPGQPHLPAERVPAVDRIYPELAIEGDGWRGLLPIMLMNVSQSARPKTAGASDTSSETR